LSLTSFFFTFFKIFLNGKSAGLSLNFSSFIGLSETWQAFFPTFLKFFERLNPAVFAVAACVGAKRASHRSHCFARDPSQAENFLPAVPARHVAAFFAQVNA